MTGDQEDIRAHREVEDQLAQFGIRVAWARELDNEVMYFRNYQLMTISWALRPCDALSRALRLWSRPDHQRQYRQPAA